MRLPLKTNLITRDGDVSFTYGEAINYGKDPMLINCFVEDDTVKNRYGTDSSPVSGTTAQGIGFTRDRVSKLLAVKSDLLLEGASYFPLHTLLHLLDAVLFLLL